MLHAAGCMPPVLAASGIVHVALGCCALHVAWCRVYVVCLRVACCTLDAAQCKFRSLRGGVCDRIAAVGIGQGACCTLYSACCAMLVACCMLHTQHQASDNVGCALHAAHSAERAACMMHFAASHPTL